MAKKLTPKQRMIRAYEKAGLTREEFADYVGINMHTLNAWLKPESSKSSRSPREDTIKVMMAEGKLK